MKQILLAVTIVATALYAGATLPSTAPDRAKAIRQLEMPGGIGYTRGDTASADYGKYMDFLYANMPLPDRMDYPREYYGENVALAMQARAEMPWGVKVPEREFKHFVLPVRVNNENLDRHRVLFYNDLRNRVKGKSMYDAILEVNRWCREHVTYQPSDPRTHSPLASVCSGIGRCGEESTYLVAALRSVGIPARQVYTPRWAHTDDNHAWVEAWADGKWYFLGACEPEPVLNLGWFNAPASRGMLMTTRVFGPYDGPEEVLEAGPDYSIINVTENYAPVKTLTVKVVDEDNQPIEGVTVDFRLYNYAEFYPIATKQTDAEGKASLKRGLGDLLIWVSKDGKYNRVLAKGDTDEVVCRLQPCATLAVYDIVPPKGGANIPEVTDAQRAANDRSNASADRMRHDYEGSFASETAVMKMAFDLSLPYELLMDVMRKARGNHTTIAEFLRKTQTARRPMALRMLASLAPKDLTDISLSSLTDALDNSPVKFADDFEVQYLLCPRAEFEFVTPHRAALKQELLKLPTHIFSASDWARWISENINSSESWQPSTVRMSPVSVMQTRKADKASRNLLFVAGARLMGFPARIDPVTSKAQYSTPDRRWVDAFPEAEDGTSKGKLLLNNESKISPAYYTHFTLSRIVDGRPQLLEYPEGCTFSDTFANGVELDAGDYMLVTGQRMADGSVLSRVQEFTVVPGQTTLQLLIMRQDSTGVQVVGNFNSEDVYVDKTTGTRKSLLSTTGRGYYVIGLVQPAHEPTNHMLRDIAALAKELEDTDVKIVLLTRNAADLSRLDAGIVKSLPKNVVWGTDIDGKIETEMIENMHLTKGDTPILLIADTFNRVVFCSQGYNIGLGRQLLDTLKKL